MFERFTKVARDAVLSAQEHARTLEHHEILPEHVLLGLLADVRCPVPRTLRRLGLTLDLEALRARVIDELQRAA